jgi:hypothetical protein
VTGELIVLAHLGGAPEAALVATPLVLLLAFGLLERRARRRERDSDTEGEA